MSNIKNAADQPYLDTGRWNWESEETLVDRRNRLPNRILRFVRAGWWWKLLLIVFVIALFDAGFMTSLLSVLGVVVQIVALLSITLVQFVAIFWFLARSRQYEVYPGTEGVGFSDYRGQPELLEQAQQIVMLLRGVKAFENAGGEPLSGVLLEGPPGTGKTWLAKAISTEAGVPFFYVDTSSLQGMFMGTDTLKVIRMFQKARKKAKEYGAAVIFLDEIDSVGSRGGVSGTGGQGGQGGMGGMFGGGGGMGLLSTLLIEMDGFSRENGWRTRWRSRWYKYVLHRKPPKPEKRVLVIGATNRISALDAALLRPGRFDKKIRVDVPDMEGRREIFEYYLSKVAHDETMDPAILATETPGYTPADIKYLLNEALRYALFDGRRYVSYRDFRLAQPEHEMGLRSPLQHISPEAKKSLAYHEAGHAVAVRLFQPENRIARITIIRQGQAFGHVSHYPAREAYQGLRTKEQHMNRLRVSVAGKAAEMEFCGVHSQTLGVAGDFRTIVNLLGAMVSAGMFDSMGAGMAMVVDILEGRARTNFTPDQARAIEETYQKILLETRTALRQNTHIVEALVALLLEKEELLADDVRAFFDQYGLHTPDPSVIRDGEEIKLIPRHQQQNRLPTGVESPLQ